MEFMVIILLLAGLYFITTVFNKFQTYTLTMYEKDLQSFLSGIDYDEIAEQNDTIETKQRKRREQYWKVLKSARNLHYAHDHCEACNRYSDSLEAHHVTYENLNYETVDDIRLLCNECHTRIHQILGYDKTTKYPIDIVKKDVLQNMEETKMD